MTALREAFENVGIESAEKKLQQFVGQARERHPRSYTKATEAMMSYGNEADASYRHDSWAKENNTRDVWQAMIDAALKETPE